MQEPRLASRWEPAYIGNNVSGVPALLPSDMWRSQHCADLNMCLPLQCSIQSNSAVAVAETVQHFITAMDSLKLNMVAVDQVGALAHTHNHGSLALAPQRSYASLCCCLSSCQNT